MWQSIAKRWSNRQRIYIVPSPKGFIFAIITALICLTGILYQNNLVYFLTFFLVALGFLMMIESNNHLKDIDLKVMETHPAAEGDTALLKIYINNVGQWSKYNVTINHRQTNSNVSVAEITKGLNEITLPIKQQNVGIYSVKKLNIRTHSPFGLFRSWRVYSSKAEFFFYPKPEGDLPAPYDQSNASSLQVSSKPTRDPEGDFDSLRHYQKGDSTKAIRWKQFARSNDLLVNQFSDGQSRKHSLHWQTTNQLPTEKKLSQFSKWVIALSAQNKSYELILPNQTINSEPNQPKKNESLRALTLMSEQLS